MKKIIGAVLVCLTLVLTSIPAFGLNVGENPGLTYAGEYAPDEIIVKFEDGVSRNDIADEVTDYALEILEENLQLGFYRMGIPQGRSVAEMAEVLNRNPKVEYAEPNYVYHACMTPNDPIYSYQWHMHDISEGGINMEPAWDLTTGTGAVVAIVDTGISRAGEDLTSTDFVAGWDFANDDSDPTDDNGHGTHCAGTVAQSTNNGVGVCGVAFGATLMPVKVLDRRGSGYLTDVADGIVYATDNGAHVISMSLGGSGTETLENAVAYAYNHGVTCVAASGNDGGAVSYPAAYDAYVIAVGATRYDTQVTDYSNHGPSLDVVAPGGDSNVDQNNDGYGDGVLQETFQRNSWGYYFFTGTSMACPHVAGTAALLYSYGVTTPDGIRAALEDNAVDLGASGWDEYYGWGLIDAYAALSNSGGTTPNSPPTADFTYSVTDLTVDFTDQSTDSDGSISSWYWEFGDGATSTAQNPSHTYGSDGTYTVSLTVTDDDGATDTASQDVTVSSSTTNSPPTADFTYTTSDLTVDFTDQSTDSDGTIASWSWDFGDGATSTAQNPSHTYAADGTFTVTLTVTDDDGATDTASQDVTVSSGSTGSYMYVSDISWSAAGPHLKSLVTIMSDSGSVVSGATVYYTLTNQDTSDSQSFTGTTDSNGQIEFMWKQAPAGYYEGLVTNVEHSSYTYDATLDVDNPDYYTH